MEFLRPPMFYGMGAPQKYLGKCFNDTTVEVAVLFAPDIQQIIDPRTIPYLRDSYEDALNNPIMAPRFKRPHIGPGEESIFAQSRSVGNTVIQIIGKSDVNENVTGVVVMIGLFDIKPLGKIRMPLKDFIIFVEEFNDKILYGVLNTRWEVTSIPNTKFFDAMYAKYLKLRLSQGK